MRFCVDAWDVSYGTALAVADEDLPASVARVETDVESADQWAPIPAGSDVPHPSAVPFVDGVRRIDARVRIDDSPAPGAGTPANASSRVETAATAFARRCVCVMLLVFCSCCCGQPGDGRLTLLPPRSAGACSPPPREPPTSRPGAAPTGPGTHRRQ